MRQDILTSRQGSNGGYPEGTTASVTYLRMLAWGMEAQGLAPPAVFAAAGVDPAVLGQRGARIPIEPVVRTWEQIVRRFDDPLVGLRLAEALPFGTSDILDYLVRSTGTVEQALRTVARYVAPLIISSDQMALVMSGNEARMRIRTGGLPQMRELSIGIFARRSRELFGPNWSLRSVSFTHSRRGPSAAYDRLFQAPVHFDMPINEAVFSREHMSVRMPDADPGLNAILTAQADEFAASMAPTPSPSSFVDAVEDAISRGLVEGDATLTRVADHLRLSPRTVQRRLRQAGLTHRAVLDRMRLDLAGRALAGPRLSQREIARALGYAGSGAFHRAFKRWSGMTPGEARTRKDKDEDRDG